MTKKGFCYGMKRLRTSSIWWSMFHTYVIDNNRGWTRGLRIKPFSDLENAKMCNILD